MVAGDTPDLPGTTGRPLVLYNGGCPFCRASARWLDRRAGSDALAFLPFEDLEARGFLRTIPATEREQSWHLVQPGGTRVSAGAAVVVVLGYLNHGRWLARGIQKLSLTIVVELLYRVVASQRSRLSRFFSSAPGPRRFP